jgi:quercetin dioxygenase-like cupin family protein
MVRQCSVRLFGVLFGVLAMTGALADDGPLPAGIEGELVLQSAETRDGDPIVYPTSTKAEITSVIGTIQPGMRTELHVHPVPAYVHVLEGEVELWTDGELPQRYAQGEAYLETINRRHSLSNVGETPARILKVFIGLEGAPTTVPPR